MVWSSFDATCISAPTGADLIIDIEYSEDGTTWSSIFGTTKLVVADGATTGEQAAFASDLPAMEDGWYLRVNVTQIGSTDPSYGVQVVGRGRFV